MDSENKSILFIGRGFGYSGSEKSFRFACESISPDFRKRTILCYRDDFADNFSKSISADVIYFEDFGLRSDANGAFEKAARMVSLIRCIKKVTDMIKPDACLAFSSFFMIPTAYACRAKKIYLVGSERGTPQNKGCIFKSVLRQAIKKYNVLASQTEVIQNYFDKLSPSESRKSIVIPNACYELPKPKNTDKKKIICSAGRLCANKNFSLLIDAFSIVNKTHPEYSLIIYGEGPERELLQNKINSLGLRGSAKLGGFCNNVADTISDNEIFVLSSNEEGIPNVLIEAMAMGLASVATDCLSGGPKLLCGNQRGKLIPCRDSTAMANACIELIENPDERKLLSENAPSVREIFSPEQICELWRSIF